MKRPKEVYHTLRALLNKQENSMKSLEKLIYSHQDEQLHFFWAFTLTIVGHKIWPPLLLLGLLVTILKEYWDKYNPPHKWEWRDIAAGVLGWITALLCL